MSSALGASGLLGTGAVAFDRERLRDAAANIAFYMDTNFGPHFEPLAKRPLAPP